MPTAGEIVRNQATNALLIIEGNQSVQDAAHPMVEAKVTAALVLAEDGVLDGIFTEHDVLYRVVARDLSASATLVSDVMTRDVLVVEPDRPVDEVEAIMSEHNVNHMPVAGETALVGLVTSTDLLHYHADRAHQHAQHLTDYIYGRH